MCSKPISEVQNGMVLGGFCVEKIKVWAKSIFVRLMYVMFGKIQPYRNKGLRKWCFVRKGLANAHLTKIRFPGSIECHLLHRVLLLLDGVVVFATFFLSVHVFDRSMGHSLSSTVWWFLNTFSEIHMWIACFT